MEIVTLMVSCIFSIFALVAKPIHAVCIFFASIIWYPQALTVALGSVDFTAGRIVILAVIFNAAWRGKLLRQLQWNLLDALVIAWFLGTCIAACQSEVLVNVIERQGGRFFDTVLPYFAVRLTVNDRANLVTFFKSVVVMSIPLAVMGFYESLTGYNLYTFLYEMQASFPATYSREVRHGFYRAFGSFDVHITFGMFLASLAPICLTLWKSGTWERWKVGGTFLLVVVGSLSSMSSAPLFSMFSSTTFILLYYARRHVIALVVLFFVSCLFLECYSNRHVYEVFTRFAYNQRTAYYRIGLINEAFAGGMTGHWLFGHGYVGPESDDLRFPWKHKDLTNIYILILAQWGLLGLIPFVAVNICFYRRLYQAGKFVQTKSDLWLIWGLAAALVGWNVAMLTVGALSQVEVLLCSFIGICANMPLLAPDRVSDAQVRVTGNDRFRHNLTHHGLT